MATDMDYGEVPGMAPHASDSRTCDYFLPPSNQSMEMALQLCAREAYLFSCMPGGHNLETGSMCISNPYLPDCPLTYANETFCRQTGYKLSELVGRNCRFLQCAETSRDVIKAIGDSFKSFSKRRRQGQTEFGAQTFRVINSKKDGTRFLNLVHMAPLYDSDNKLVRIMGCQFGLGLVVGSQMASLFQGVLDDSELLALQKTTRPMVLAEWRGMKPTSQLGVGSREQTILHMQKIMASTINDIIKAVDFNAMLEVAGMVESSVAQQIPFVGAAGGPQGMPMQGMATHAPPHAKHMKTC